MTALTMVLLGVGLLLLAIVATHATLAMATAFRQFGMDREQRDLSITLLRNKIDAMKALHKEYKEVKQLTWNGLRKFECKTKKEGGGVTSCYLYPHDKKKLPPFKPGQYLTFQLKIKGEEKPLIRCYSLSDSPKSDYYRVSVKKVPPPRDRPELPPGKSSTHFNDVLKDGDILDVKAPSGAFFLETKDQHPIVLIGGGIGITPVFSMLQTLIDENSDREIWFFYGVRNGKEAVYKQELKEIRQKNANVKMNICYSRPDATDQDGEDYQHAARVTVDLFKQVLPNNNFEFYICGPPPMMQTLVPDLETWGVNKKKIKYEAFGPATVKKAKPKEEAKPEGAAAEKKDGPKITFSSSGKSLVWTGEADSLLEFAEDNDISMSSGCRVGNCGTCMVAVKSGEVEYGSEPSFEPEAGSCLACVAIPKGPVEIDA